MFKLIHHHWHYRWDRFYSKSRWHLALDIALSVIIILLLSVVITLFFYHPKFNPGSSNGVPVINTPIDLNNPPLEISSALATSSLDIKEGATLSLGLKNNSSHDLSNLKFTFNLLNKDFVIDHLELINKDNPDILVSGQELSVPSLPSNLKGEISLKVYFKNKNNSSSKEIDWQLNTSYTVAGQNLKGVVDLPILYLASVLSVEARAYYNSPQGDQLGSGPLPPLVGLPTNYWIFVNAVSDGNFSNYIYSAKLPQGVELVGNRSILSGDFSYNKSTRQIIWRIPLVEAGVNDYRADFEVQLIPSDNQADKILPLLSSARYSAKETGGLKKSVEETIPSPTTNLDYDAINKGQGRVGK